MAGIRTIPRIARSVLLMAALCMPVHATVVLAAALPVEAGPESGQAEEGWQAFVAGHALTPQRLVAVDKARQLLFLFERKSPLRIAEQYVCTTGRAVGDKVTEGDLKTPEGIYFVVSHVTSGLDFIKYGNEAYTLNYPNPVDRIRRKTGYGIWIHGRGEPIRPLVTEGCVSLNNGDIAVLGSNLEPGAPVTLASSVIHAQNYAEPDARMLALLAEKTRAWNKAWGARSAALFDFYDQEAYSIANESFSAFRAQKERLFKMLPWINTTIRDVHVLPGPGYWVTWFFQDYKAPNLSTRGVRRLYWQPDETGEPRIVGMEWLPQLSGTLLASRNAASDASEVPVAEGGQNILSVAAAVPEIPVEPSAEPVGEPVAEPVEEAPVVSAAAETVPRELPPDASQDAGQHTVGALTVQAGHFIERWRNAWENGDLGAYMAFYAADARQEARSGAAAIGAHKRTNWKKKPPVLVRLSAIRIVPDGDTVTATMRQEYEDSSGYRDVGVKTLILRRVGETLEILQETWVAE